MIIKMRFLRLLLISACMIRLSDHFLKEILFARGPYLFRWWDVVEDKIYDQYCSASPVFVNTSPLLTNCNNTKIGEWISTLTLSNAVKPKRVAIIPAQALFYKTKGLPTGRISYLSISWNDFVNRRKALDSMRFFVSMDKNKECGLLSDVEFIVFRTSTATLVGSWSNFGKASGLPAKMFEQSRIEALATTELVNCFVVHQRTFGHQTVDVILPKRI